MASFNEKEAEEHQRLDWQILRNGAISLFYAEDILEEACEWFRQHAYQVHIF